MDTTLNLVPPRLLARRAQTRRRQQQILILAAAVVPVLFAYAALDLRLGILRAQAASLTRQIAPLQAIAAQTRRLDADLETLRQSEGALSRLTRGPRWSVVLAEFGRLIPEEVWFTNLTVSDGRVVIQGRSLSQTAVAVLATRLAGAPFLTGASLAYIREEAAGGRRTFVFEISAKVVAEAGSP
jgi:Tfp pilus assembly protein PilN